MPTTTKNRRLRLTKPEMRVIEFLKAGPARGLVSDLPRAKFWLANYAASTKAERTRNVQTAVGMALLEKGVFYFEQKHFSTVTYALNSARLAELMALSGSHDDSQEPALASELDAPAAKDDSPDTALANLDAKSVKPDTALRQFKLSPTHLRVTSLLQEGWSVVSDLHNRSYWLSEKARLGPAGRTTTVSRQAVQDLMGRDILVFDKELFSTNHYRLDLPKLAELDLSAIGRRAVSGRREADRARAAVAPSPCGIVDGLPIHCAHCGGAPDVCKGHHNFVDAKVVCQTCNAEGPLCDDEGKTQEENVADAIAAWNQRVAPSEKLLPAMTEAMAILAGLGNTATDPAAGVDTLRNLALAAQRILAEAVAMVTPTAPVAETRAKKKMAPAEMPGSTGSASAPLAGHSGEVAARES